LRSLNQIKKWKLHYAAVSSLYGGQSISTTVASSVDLYSKSKGLKNMTFTYVNIFYNTTETEKINSRDSTVTSTYHPQYNGEYKVSVRVSDGTFSDDTTLGYVMYTGGENCNTCSEIF